MVKTDPAADDVTDVPTTDGYWNAAVDALGRLKPGTGPGKHAASEDAFDGVASDVEVLAITSPEPEPT